MNGYLDAKQAAGYLGVSRSHFLAKIAPFVTTYDLGTPKRGMRRWRREDLDGWAERRRVA